MNASAPSPPQTQLTWRGHQLPAASLRPRQRILLVRVLSAGVHVNDGRVVVLLLSSSCLLETSLQFVWEKPIQKNVKAFDERSPK